MALSAFSVRVNEMWPLEEEEIKFIYKMRLPRGKFFQGFSDRFSFSRVAFLPFSPRTRYNEPRSTKNKEICK